MHGLRLAIGLLAALGAAAILLAIAFAWLWPDDWGALERGWPARIVLACFYTRVFQMHGAAVAAAFSLVAIAGRAWRAGLVLLVAAAFALLPYAREYAPKAPPAPASPTLRLLSMNLFAFNYDAPRILAAIDQANPDVIVAVEVTTWSEANVFARLARRYPWSSHPDYDGGALVISRVPIKPDHTNHPAGTRSPTVFQIGGEDVALYGVHTVSPGSSNHLLRNRQQASQLAAICAAERRPTIVAGDCNFTQLSPQYRWMIGAGMRSTHDLVGFGVGNTWGPKWHPKLNELPGVRIDQIFLSRGLTATNHYVGPYTGSDHRPIIADIALAAQPTP